MLRKLIPTKRKFSLLEIPPRSSCSLSLSLSMECLCTIDLQSIDVIGSSYRCVVYVWGAQLDGGEAHWPVSGWRRTWSLELVKFGQVLWCRGWSWRLPDPAVTAGPAPSNPLREFQAHWHSREYPGNIYLRTFYATHSFLIAVTGVYCTHPSVCIVVKFPWNAIPKANSNVWI